MAIGLSRNKKNSLTVATEWTKYNFHYRNCIGYKSKFKASFYVRFSTSVAERPKKIVIMLSLSLSFTNAGISLFRRKPRSLSF
jgi:hypothetical protein